MNTESSASAPVPSPVPSIVELLGHAEWARRLARELTADEGRAEDAVQDAYVAALEHPPERRENVRGWIARVVANRIRMRGRAETRRARRERASAREEALPSAAELAGEIEWQRRIADAVLELDEPQRSTVLLHFYRQLPLAEIARRQGEPAATVRSRLKRALDQLRARFDSEHGGDRRAWSVLLTTWSAHGTKAAAAVSPALPLATWIGLALLGSVGTVVVWRTNARTEPPAPPVALGDSRASPSAPDSTLALEPAAPFSSRGSERTLASDPSPKGGPAASFPFFGFVKDSEGNPISGGKLAVYAGPGWTRAEPTGTGTSGPDGRFAFAADSAGFRISAEAEGFVGVSIDLVKPGQEIEIVLGSGIQLSGIVRDASTSRPLADVQLSVGAARCHTDDAGRYRLSGVQMGTVRVSAHLDGYADDDREIHTRGPEPQTLDFELMRGVPVELEVFDRDTGATLASVEVRRSLAESPWTRTDGRGRFTEWIVPEHTVKAELALEDYWPLTWNWTPESPGPTDASPAPRLPMVRKAWIEGRITDEHGAAMSRTGLYASTGGPPRLEAPKAEEMRQWGTPGRVHYTTQNLRDEGTSSDADGRYRLAVFAGERPFKMNVFHPGFVRIVRGPIELPRGSRGTVLDFVLVRGAKIHGQVRMEEGHDTDRVVCRDSTGGDTVSEWIKPDGTYVLDGVPAGTWLVAVLDQQLQVRASSTITVEAGSEYQRDFSLVEDRPSGRISGRVVCASGRRLPPNVLVVAYPSDGSRREEKTTGVSADGSFALDVSAGRRYAIHAWDANGRVAESEPRDVEAGAEGIELVLPEVGRLKLCFVDARTRERIQPRSQLLVNAMRTRHLGTGAVRSYNVEIDVGGCLQLAAIPVGDYEISLDFAKEGYRPIVLPHVPVESDPEAREQVIELVRGVDARIRIANAAGGDATPMHHVIFLVERRQLDLIDGPCKPGDPRSHYGFGNDPEIRLRIDDPSLMSQFLDHQEYFEDGETMSGLAPGHYFLKCYPDDLVFEPSEFDISGPDRTNLRITWRPK